MPKEFYNVLFSFNNVYITAYFVSTNCFDKIHYYQKGHTKAVYI